MEWQVMLNYSGNSFFIVYIFLINGLRMILNAFFFLNNIWLNFPTPAMFAVPNSFCESGEYRSNSRYNVVIIWN